MPNERRRLAPCAALLVAASACTAAPHQSAAPTSGRRYEPGVVLHRVRPGETLSAIAARYATRGGWNTLASLNGIDDPDRLEAGEGVRIPLNIRSVGLRPIRGPLPPLQTETMCKSREAPPPQDQDPIGCTRVACTELDGIRACTCEDDAGWRITLSGERTSTWQVPGLPSADRLHMQLIDLDADGRDEVVIATHFSTANGSAGITTAVGIFGHDGGPPLQLWTNRAPEWLEFPALGDECLVRAHEGVYASSQFEPPKDYSMRRDYRYTHGALEHVWTRPSVAQREDRAWVLVDEKHPRDEVGPNNPARSGLIEGVFAGDPEGPALTFALDDHQSYPIAQARLYGWWYPVAYVPENPQQFLGLHATLTKNQQYDREYLADLRLPGGSFPSPSWAQFWAQRSHR